MKNLKKTFRILTIVFMLAALILQIVIGLNGPVVICLWAALLCVFFERKIGTNPKTGK